MFLWKIILKRKVNNMSNKILNEYYKDYLKKISNENEKKYYEERSRDKNENSKVIKNSKNK